MEAKGKGKGPKGTKGDGPKGGKGKDGPFGGRGKGQTLTKPEIRPSKAMKPLWWRRLLLGSDIKPGAVWEKVSDQSNLLPVEKIEARFSKAQTGAKLQAEPSEAVTPVIRISAVHERELRLLPPPDEVGQSLLDLDDRLALDELERIQMLAPSTKDIEALKTAQQLQPDASVGRMEEYWLAICKVPAFRERMSCWHFIRTYRERVSCHSEHLQDLSDMFSSIDSCEALSALLGSILSTGNWLNSGTEAAGAFAFELELLQELHKIKGADNLSLQHLIFREFFDSLNSGAADLLEALSPTLQNVNRKVIKDTDGVKIGRSVHVTLEDCDETISSLQAEYSTIKGSLGECLAPLDPADPVKLRLEREFQAASMAIDNVAQRCQAVKLQYDNLLHYLQSTKLRSNEFCLMWDNFLLPEDVLLARYQEPHNNSTFETYFCQGDTFSLDDFQALWQLAEPQFRTFSAEEGDPPFQRQRSRSPAEPQDSPVSCSSPRKERGQLIPLSWRKLEVPSGVPSVWRAVEAHAAPSAPPAELRSRFSVQAVAEAEKRRVANEARFRFEESAKESQERWAVLACQLPKVEDLLQLLKEPSQSGPCQCTHQQLKQVQKLLSEEASEAAEEVKYRQEVGDVEHFQERLSLAAFLMSYRQAVASCSETLEELLDIAQCFQYSEALPHFLAVALASGNYLNGGTQRGQADGFDFSEMDKLQGVQDSEGKDLRHFILEVLCQHMPLQAEQLLRELRPCFLNVRRAISKDAVGTAKLTKTVVHVLEAVDEEVTEMLMNLEKAEGALNVLPDTKDLKLELTKASVLVNEVVAVRDSAKAAFENLFGFLAMKPMRTSDFCMLWDNFFVPEDLMVNKGKDDYFVPAFCREEPFKLEHIQVLWSIQRANGKPEESEETAAEGPLDAEQFCNALIPLVQSPEDFASNAASFSSCPGTKSNGGDLGEVERGQMHPAIEAALFDPELELGVPLGPVQTDAGYHLLMARKKCRGILSTTVSASHILVKHGRYRAPACEASIHLPNLVGEEGDVTRTWRRWSFAHSLPPALTHLAEAQEEASQLQQKRQALDGQAGLRLLFRWEGAFVFNVKGILSDIAGDMIGPINLVDGSTDTEPKQLGDLLTTDDARTLHPDKDGFEGRLRWIDSGWQDAGGLLDAESMCTVQILLRRFDADAAHTRKTCHSVRLRIKPTRLAYATSEQGLRLGLSSPLKVQDRACTLVQQLDTGEILVKVDNGCEEIVDARPRTVVGANHIQRLPGSKILLLHDGEHLVHAEVLEVFDRKHGNRHRVAYDTGDQQDVEIDLNEMNHSSQRFTSAQEFEEARASYCSKITQEGRYIEDAITGNRVDISEQIVRIEMEVKKQPNADALKHMAFDDLEWVSETSFRLGDRVWAQGREGLVEHLQKHGRYMVKFSDGTSSPALHASSIKRAQAIAGVQHRDFAEVRDIADVVPLLLHPSRFLQGRLHGSHSSQPILIRAGPGTGKTWSMQQLLFLLAKELSTSRTKIQLQLVPLLIPIQKLARMLRQHAANSKEGPPSNLVLFYIQAEFPAGATRSMLEQAFEMRSLIVMLDGIDEAASMKLAVEDYVTKTLVPMGVPLLVTSRPEGIRKRLYSRDFVIMNLKPLSQDQQYKIIEKQLQQNEFFKHLMVLSETRKAQEEIFHAAFSSHEIQEFQRVVNESQLATVETVAVPSDHDVLAAVFFCLAIRLLGEAGLDGSALQLPVELGPGESRDMSRRLSLHARKTGSIRSDFVCPSASSFLKVLKLFFSGFNICVDGEEAKLEMTACDSSFFNDPGPLRFRWVSCQLSLQYQQKSHLVKVQVHHSQSLECFRQAGVQEHYSFVEAKLRDHHGGDQASSRAMLEAKMRIFEEICRVPVLLSVLACAFAVEVQDLPSDIYELYEMGMRATLQRQLEKDQVSVALEMLEAIAVANHLAKRRTFQVEDLQEALKAKPYLLLLWSQLLEGGCVPLVKILTLGHSTGEFQFSHLSFQEALFVRALKSGCKNFWSDATLNCSLNDPFYRNAFAIGRNHLGEALSLSKPRLDFDCQPRLTEIGRAGLRNLLAGVRSLTELDLANVSLENPEEVEELVSALTAKVPNLQVLGLSKCRLSQASARAIGTVVHKCPLKRLDLEGNTAFLISNEAVNGLAESVGQRLQPLDFLSLRWCHIQPAVAPAVKNFLEICCESSTILDIQGNRGLSKELLHGFTMLRGS